MVSFLSGTPKMSSGTIKRLSGHKPMIDVDLLDEPGDRYWINWIYRIPTVNCAPKGGRDKIDIWKISFW